MDEIPFLARLAKLPDHAFLVVGLALSWRNGEEALPRQVAFDDERRRRGLFAKPDAPRRRALRRALSLDWWLLPYAASLLLRGPDSGSQRVAVDELQLLIDAAWQTLTRRLSPDKLPPLATLRRAAPERHTEHPEVSVNLARQLRALYGFSTVIDTGDITSRLAELYDPGEVARPDRAENRYENLAYLPHAPIDVRSLELRWADQKKELEAAMGEQFTVYEPLLDVLAGRVLSEWTWLSEPYTFESCLALIEKMREDYHATVLAYEMLKTALIVGGDSWRAEQVADRMRAFIAARPPRRREELSDARADSHIDAESGRAGRAP